jgi:hypothetical protein
MRTFNQWIWVFIFLVQEPLNLFAQSGFYRTFDWYQDMEINYCTLSDQNRVYIQFLHYCGDKECSSIAAFDFEGNVLWNVVVPDIDVGWKGLTFYKDLLLVAGNATEPGSTGFRMAYYDKQGNKIGKTHAIDSRDLQLTSTFHLSTEVQGDRVFHFGMGNAPKSSSGFTIVTDSIGNILNLYKNVTSDDFSMMFESFVDRSGTITAMSLSIWQDPIKDTIEIIKFDDLGNEKKKYSIKKQNIYDFVISSVDLHDGSHVLTTVSNDSMRFRPGIHCIGVDNTVKWETLFDAWGGHRTINRFKTATNGDVYGAGRMAAEVGSIRNASYPWLFRMSPTGKVIWSRGFPEYTSDSASVKTATFSSFEILNDGSLFLVGNIFNKDYDTFVMRVDSSGCVTMSQCGSLNILTKSEPPKFSEIGVSIYPNPMQGDQLNISIDSPEEKGPYELLIYDLLGRLVHQQSFDENSEVLTLDLPSGTYLVTVLESGQPHYQSKLVIPSAD